MVDELRIYTLRAGGMARYLELAEKVAVPIRGDRHGTLLGFWAGEVGAANSVFNLWRHESVASRQAVRATLQDIPAWREQYLAGVRPLMQRQIVRLMDVVLPLTPPPDVANLYECRIIRAVVGRTAELADAVATTSAGDGSTTVGVWSTFAGPINEVVQIVAYPDARARFARSWHGGDSPLARWSALVEEVETSLMLAAPHSPLR
ncbi:NIPSNAP family protein [Muricoccus radiodurans]|uniref:NIPSNAP family protein n=1 Tax=Muricoccus radiodurans TaxID=2231721 RepID=UPI003CEA2444